MHATKLMPRAGILAAAFCLVAADDAPAASKTRSASIPKFSRFELALTSGIAYGNPLREVQLTAAFISPLGETNQVEGFWDGGKTWRIRFAPDLPGQWRYTTHCSDAANTNLHRQSGGFKCVAALTKTALDRHGPIRVARDRRHFEHADHTPFLWLGDAVWNGARLSSPEDWQLYSGVRASQKFTVVQWTVAPGRDAAGETAFTDINPIALNVKFFQRLDAKIATANRAGLVCAIASLQEFGGGDAGLSEEAATALVRYANARWAANHVAWLLAFEGDSIGRRVDRWKRIGRETFAHTAHAPVILLPGETQWLLDEFRDEAWLDAFALPTIAPDENGLQWLLSGPLSAEWKKNPPRPILNLTPSAELAADGSDARRLVWFSLLNEPTAGAGYAANPIIHWDTNIVTNPSLTPRTMPAWRNALFLPGAKSIAMAADFFSGVDFSGLRPAPRQLKSQPGLESPRRHIAVASTENKQLTLAYVPEDRAIEVAHSALPAAPSVVWLNVCTGEQKPAVAVVSGATCNFPTPNPGDWLLVVKAEK